MLRSDIIMADQICFLMSFRFQIQVEFGNVDRSIMLRSSSSRVEFPGYQEVFTVWLVLADKLYCEEVLFILVMVRYHLSIQLIALYK